MDVIRNSATPAEAKKLGRSRAHPIRPDWDSARVDVMRKALHAKFTQHEVLRVKLLNTGVAQLIERSDVDDYWGDGRNRRGQNRLGTLLTELRSSLFAASDPNAVNATNSSSSGVSPNTFKQKSHTTAMDRAIKKKTRNRDRRNVWKDESGSSILVIDNDDPQTAILFKEPITVPMAALPQEAKHVMHKHQYVRKYADNIDDEEEELDEADEEDNDDSGDSSGSGRAAQRVKLGDFLSGKIRVKEDEAPAFASAHDCIGGARALLAVLATNTSDEQVRRQCRDYAPLLARFVELPQSEEMMFELLGVIDALNLS